MRKGTYNGLKPYPLVILVLSSSSTLIGISDPFCLSCNPVDHGIDGSLVQKRGCQPHSLVNQDDVPKLTIHVSYTSKGRSEFQNTHSDLEGIVSPQRLAAWVALSIPYLGNHSVRLISLNNSLALLPTYHDSPCLWINKEDFQNTLQPLSTPIPEFRQVSGTKGKAMDCDSSSF